MKYILLIVFSLFYATVATIISGHAYALTCGPCEIISNKCEACGNCYDHCVPNPNPPSGCIASPTPTTTYLACGAECGIIYTQCGAGCPYCTPGDGINGYESRCTNKAPTPTVTKAPTPTQVKLACGEQCSEKGSYKSQCSDECPYCGENGYTYVCKPAPTSKPSPTPKKLACGAACKFYYDPKKDKHVAIKGECDEACPCVATKPGDTVDPHYQCAGGTPTPKSSPTPTLTVTPTPPPACNISCKTNEYCEDALDGCTVCSPSSGGGKTCQPPPTHTPTPSVTNTPTPTPFPFSEDMCKCDGMEIGQVTSGQDVLVTAYGKVEGENTAYARITSYSFFAAKGDAGSPDITIFNRSGPIAADIVSTSQNLIRSKANWTLKFPASPEPGKEYRVWNTIKCEPNTTTSSTASTGESIPVKSSSQTLFQRVVSFFFGLFNWRNSSKTEDAQTIQSENDQLQLDTFKLGRIVPDPATACYMVKIRFD